MCGIFGIVSDELPSHKAIKNALDSLRHRGPDDEGYVLIRAIDGEALPLAGSDTPQGLKDRYRDIREGYSSGYNVMLANRRLAIIDLSPKGHQPMSYANNSLWITYNGELFNHVELRRELEVKGYRFDSAADTEVILAAYAEWGAECVNRFNGQWAFCIYDRRNTTLFCSRDRFGIKPFYYWFDGKTFAFASEIKALLALPFIKVGIDESLLLDLVIFHMHHHTNETIYDSIHQVPPSHNLTFSLQDMSLSSKRYYTLPFNNEVGTYVHGKAAQFADDIRELLIDAVRVRLVSDVPVGSCLSGGMDSSSIVAIISMLLREKCPDVRSIGERQKTFTGSVDDPSLDEKCFAEEMIRHTGVEGHFVYPSAKRLWKEIDRFLFHHDNICKSTNVYAGWCVMDLASRHVKVVLNGQGGDELFGGYPRHELICASDLLKGGRFWDMCKFLSGQKMRHGIALSLNGFLMGSYLAFTPDFLKVLAFKQRNKVQWERLRDFIHGAGPDKRSFDRMSQCMSSLNYQLQCDITQGYLRQLLSQDDRNASAFSMENRVPFLDHRLVEYVSSIPSIYKVHNGWSKWLLRLAMRELLPDKILWRKDKIGFATPSERWSTHADSPILPLMRHYGIKQYKSQYLWKFYIAHRLINLQKPGALGPQ